MNKDDINTTIEQSKIDYEYEDYERIAKVLEESYKEWLTLPVDTLNLFNDNK